MRGCAVRLDSVEIFNFKNVKYGFLDFGNARKKYKSSILGLYGQNGSGKTALIEAIALLKCLLTGQPVPSSFAECVNVDSCAASFRFKFKIICDTEKTAEYIVLYGFSIRKDIDENVSNMEQVYKHKVTVFDETLSVSSTVGKKNKRLFSWIDTRTEKAFIPISKLKLLIGRKEEAQTDLLVTKKIAAATSRSFIFSRELVTKIREQCQDQGYLDMYNALIYYGNYELFVIDTRNSGLISINALPISFSYEEKGQVATGNLLVQLNGVSFIPEPAMGIVRKLISSMNIVLQEIIPGLKIEIKELGNQIQKDGIQVCCVQLMSLKNSKSIPLQYESEGIKKIISVLNLLIGVYNKPSITVAIDELDAGIFEYLLGELLSIIADKGKGQLIFTSHNLRPLETLDRGFIAFTTTNPEKRYIRLKNIKTNNNLRDFYYRDIMLGEQDEPVYEPTNRYDIAFALKEAGDSIGA